MSGIICTSSTHTTELRSGLLLGHSKTLRLLSLWKVKFLCTFSFSSRRLPVLHQKFIGNWSHSLFHLLTLKPQFQLNKSSIKAWCCRLHVSLWWWRCGGVCAKHILWYIWLKRSIFVTSNHNVSFQFFYNETLYQLCTVSALSVV